MLKYLSHAVVVTSAALIVFVTSVLLCSDASIEEHQKYQKIMIVFVSTMFAALLMKQYQEELFHRQARVILIFYRNGTIHALKNADPQEIIECAETEFKMTYRFDISDSRKFFIRLRYKADGKIFDENLPAEFSCGLLGEAIRVIEQNREDIRIVRNVHELLALATDSGQSDSPLIRNYILSQM